MLSQTHRLPTSFFRTHTRPTQTYVVGCVSVRIFCASQKQFRCAVVVPIKTTRTAVCRNRVRRVAYDVVRMFETRLPIVDVVFFLSSSDHIRVHDDMERACQQLMHIHEL